MVDASTLRVRVENTDPHWIQFSILNTGSQILHGTVGPSETDEFDLEVKCAPAPYMEN